jgi:hypothetical protein
MQSSPDCSRQDYSRCSTLHLLSLYVTIHWHTMIISYHYPPESPW